LPVILRALRWLLVAMAIGAAPMLGAAELLDLNTATVKQLAALPGLGAERAKMIVRVREKSGPFRTLEGLLALPRLTRRQFEELKSLLFVGEENRAGKPNRKQSGTHDDPQG